jgi:hypothetical protein
MTEIGELILPTPLRVGADNRFDEGGVTIAFLDSGFSSHPDLTKPEKRVLYYTTTPAPHAAYHTPEAPTDQQGWDVVIAARAVERVLAMRG